MAAMPTDLLPPASTPLERALADATARIGDVPIPLAALWDPATCPVAVLPWLAWGLSVDNWDPNWGEATKRTAISQSIAIHRIKGTPASVEAVLARFDELLTIVEWHETTPRRAPHTFEIILDLVAADGSTGGERATAAFAERIIADITRVKPLREHFILVQKLAVDGLVGVQGALRTAGFRRQRHAVVMADETQPWALLLQDQNGEPLQSNDGTFLEHAP